jgi:hypothetical protein
MTRLTGVDDVRSAAIINAFLDGARTVCHMLCSAAVVANWSSPSVLDEQTVGGLAGHVARSGIWVVASYLDAGEREGEATFATAGAYYAAVMAALGDDGHRGIRERGAQVAAAGPDEVAATASERLTDLEQRLPALAGDLLVEVVGGATIPLAEYLQTRIVEQVVHLDDLARSVGDASWQVPESCQRIALEVALDIGIERFGPTPMLRALYRGGFGDETLPVL